MPTLSLTLREIKKIERPQTGRVDYFDTELKGFFLRVSADYIDKAGTPRIGSRVFYVQAGVLDQTKGKYVTRKAKVGAFGELTPDEARGKARLLLQDLRAGLPSAPACVPTLKKMLELHLTDKKLKPSTERAYRAEIPGKFHSWLGLPLSSVSKIAPDVMIDRFKQVEREHGPMAAKTCFEKLQALLNYAKVKYPAAVPSNPCSAITDAGLWPKTRRRTDCLKGNEFLIFRRGIETFNEVTRDCLLFALYHGLRNIEAASLRWESVDLEQRTLTIAETKNGKPLQVPLSRQSTAILERRQAENPPGGPHVFPSLNAHHPSKAGHVTLRATMLKYYTGLDITVHGLRRSFITAGERLKLRRQDIDKLTNHTDGSVTGQHYDATDTDDLREPLQTIANEIERLMLHGTGGKVLELPTARATG